MAAVGAARAGVEAAASGLARSQSALDKAGLDLDRIQQLAVKGFASAAALDNVLAAHRLAEADVRASRALVQSRRAELHAAEAALIGPEARTAPSVSVTAPVSGYVTRLFQESERTVSVGAPLLEIADPRGLEAAIEFLSQDAVRIRPGMSAEIYDWGGAPLSGVVRRVEPQGFTKVSALGVEEQRVLVFVPFDRSPSARSSLGAGYRIRGRVFVRRAPDAIKAPVGALVRDGGGWAVYRIADGRARLARLRLGAFAEREVEVVAGLAPGDTVIVFPTDRIREGVRVSIRPQAAG